MSFKKSVPALLFLIPAFAQTLAPRLEFEVASVKPSPTTTAGSLAVGIKVDGAQLTCTLYSLRDYVRMAYTVKDYQIIAPEWMASERYDVVAKLPDGATRADVPGMMQGLLAERFKLTFHHETKEFPVYVLLQGKNAAKLKLVVDTTDPADSAKAPVNMSASGSSKGVSIDLGRGSYFAMADSHVDAKKIPMATLSEMLGRFLDLPVIDMTKLTGNYDLNLEISPEDYRTMLIRSAMAAGVSLPPEVRLSGDLVGPGDSLMAAIEKAGLKLERRKAPLEAIVIDHAEKTPTSN